ncbi:hypothetical protein PENTCL1PPCAC_21471 [Pristionchus entomophagus]|uniref:F-box domain-containing protein n=1 Tax=Pristionchus entomophagus TaxID=358040 RepID=A0AAV5TYF9_9BILA|nr:hypothetical protein PENTCL1PPCAC_21471 [Pristionchus entomophagus]
MNYKLTLLNLPSITLPRLLGLAKTATVIHMGVICSSLTAHDLADLSKAMLDGSCKLEMCVVYVPSVTKDAFLRASLGLTIIDGPIEYHSRTYQAMDESIEIYSHSHRLVEIYHNQDGLQTFCEHWRNRISFSTRARNERNPSGVRMRLNHRYR